MKFDYTKGRKAKYAVQIYDWNITDIYYFGDYKSAREMFVTLKDETHAGTIVSLHDLEKDVRKEFVRK